MSFVQTLVRGGLDASRRAAEVALAFPRIALALERLADSRDDLRKLADAADDLRRLINSLTEDDVAVARETLQGLLDTVNQLNGVVGSLNTTISPLQGATDRLGRLVDRLPQGRRRVIDSPSEPLA